MNDLIKKLFRTFLEKRILSRWFVLFIDMVIVVLSTIISYTLTLQIYKNIPSIEYPDFFQYLAISVGFNLFFFLFFKTYQGIVRYTTIHEFQKILFSLFLAGGCIFFSLYAFIGPSGSVSIAYCSTLFFTSLTGLYGFRIVVVFIYQRLQQTYSKKPSIPVYVWAIDEESLSLSQLLNTSQTKFLIKGFITNTKDSKSKFKNMTSLPIIIANSVSDILELDIKDILFTNKDALKRDKEIVEQMIDKNMSIYITQDINIDSVSQLSEISKSIRPIQIEDLLGRPEIEISKKEISADLHGKVILVTGAAGSIGSEIVRQIATFSPKMIVCFDQAETPLNDLNIELSNKFSNLKFVSIIGDIRNKNRTQRVFQKYKPQIVYHTAAYKHVPLMEKDPCEAIITNALGTKNIVDLSIANKAEMFVMVSTDKAVNPTNIMGATKRIAEIYVQSCALEPQKNIYKTKFVTTRFGNVLGSNGSVIPLFRKQIEAGGPITVTHQDITRYFMTIPEACRLVLEASVIGQSGYIYIFDMGDPVKIYDLAEKMIELAGLKVDEDIKIEFSGLRPGEKLYEELLNDSEITEDAIHEKIMMAKVRKYQLSEVEHQLEQIIMHAKDGNKIEMVTLMKRFIPEFISNNSEFEALDKKQEVDIKGVV